MQFNGAVIIEQGVTFAVVIVRRYILDNRAEADKIIRALEHEVFPGLPVVLMAQDGAGTPTYYGRQDISRFMAHVPLSSIPWKKYTATL